MIVIEKRKSGLVFRKPGVRDICTAVYMLTMLIPPGYVASYGSIAKILGIHPRSVAYCLKNNDELVVIPCHRVVHSTGKIGGYSKLGSVFKKRLLSIEGVFFEDEETVSQSSIIDLEKLLGNEG